MKFLDKIANIMVILGVIVFLFLVARNEYARYHTGTAVSVAMVGKRVILPGARLPQDRDSLIFALSTTCHFCKESLPFYQQLVTRSDGRVNLVAVLPQPQAEAQMYLQNASIPISQVVSTGLDVVGVSATPTLLLVNSRGDIKKLWIGLLDEKGQQEVLSAVVPALNSASPM
jgi:thiol-disulfide isomerase/thioredoxin